MTKINMDEVAMLIEIRGVYDGWSIAEMKDGSLINRWDEDDPRFLPTEDFIDGMMLDRAEEEEYNRDIMAPCLDCDTSIYSEYLRCASCDADYRDSVS